MTTDGSRVTVGIVNYRTRDRLRECLRALSDHPGPVMVVDNASGDGSVEMVRAEFPDVILDAGADNVGYGAAANRMLAEAATPYLLLLNADARATPGAVAALEAKLDAEPEVAVVGPRLRDERGRLQRSCRRFPTLGSFFIDQSGLRPVVDALGIGDRERGFGHDDDRLVPWVLGAVLALRVDTVSSVGGFDPSYFLYFEEIDLCRRLADHGHRTLFTADAEFDHIGGASSSGRSVVTEQWFHRSGAIWFARHGSALASRWYRRAAAGALIVNALAVGLRRRRNDWPFVRRVLADRRNWSPEPTWAAVGAP